MSTKTKPQVKVNTSKLLAGKMKKPPTDTNDNLGDDDGSTVDPVDAAAAAKAANEAEMAATAQIAAEKKATDAKKKTDAVSAAAKLAKGEPEVKVTAEFVAPKSKMDDFDMLAVTLFGFKRGSKSKMFIELVEHYKNNPPDLKN